MTEYCYCCGFAHRHTSTDANSLNELMTFKEFQPKIDLYTGCIEIVKFRTPKIFQKEI